MQFKLREISSSLKNVQKFLVPENFLWRIVNHVIFAIAPLQVFLKPYSTFYPVQLFFDEPSNQGRQNDF